MKVPTIHLNGTSAEVLLEQVCDAGDALHRAIEALAAATPNGRDYYPQGPEALKEAMTEHRDRLDRLQSVQAELSALAEAITDAEGV